MQIVLNNSKKSIILKQKLFIGNWDKSITTGRRNNASPVTNNSEYGELCAYLLFICI